MRTVVTEFISRRKRATGNENKELMRIIIKIVDVKFKLLRVLSLRYLIQVQRETYKVPDTAHLGK